MYKIIGADQKEYGPISTDQIRQWITEGRINANSLIQLDGGSWKKAIEFPEFATHLGPTVPPPLPPSHSAPIYMPPPGGQTNQLAIWSMVTGILSFLCCGYLGPVAIVLGFVAQSQLKKNPQDRGSGFATAGIVLGILGLLMWIAYKIFFPDILQTMRDMMKQMSH